MKLQVQQMTNLVSCFPAILPTMVNRIQMCCY